jgi:hypothetical protein
MTTLAPAIAAVLALVTLGATGSPPAPGIAPARLGPTAGIETRRGAPAVHDIHLTYTRMVVDGATVVCRVRLFKDDLERALQDFAKQPSLDVGTTPGADSIFAAYFNTRAALSADGEELRGRVVQSGLDADATDQQMWWYLIELPARKPVRTLSVRIALLFETFRDQKNVVTLLKMPGEQRHSLYFAGEDAKAQRLDFTP